jgi:hypothetical protein
MKGILCLIIVFIIAIYISHLNGKNVYSMNKMMKKEKAMQEEDQNK